MKIIITWIVALLLTNTLMAQETTMKKAYFAGGCFWGGHNPIDIKSPEIGAC